MNIKKQGNSSGGHGKFGHNGAPPSIQVDNYHHHANELEELRKIAEISPELADKIVDQRDKENNREHVSERMGMTISFTLGALVLLVILLLIFYGGVWKLLIGILIIVVLTAFVRAVITGEWSDTSWVGSAIQKLASLLGSEAPNDDAEE